MRDYAPADALEQVNETLSTLAEQTENNFTWAVSKVCVEIEQDMSEKVRRPPTRRLP